MTHNDAAEYMEIEPWTLTFLRLKGRGPKFYQFVEGITYYKEDIDLWLETPR